MKCLVQIRESKEDVLTVKTKCWHVIIYHREKGGGIWIVTHPMRALRMYAHTPSHTDPCATCIHVVDCSGG